MPHWLSHRRIIRSTDTAPPPPTRILRPPFEPKLAEDPGEAVDEPLALLDDRLQPSPTGDERGHLHQVGVDVVDVDFRAQTAANVTTKAVVANER